MPANIVPSERAHDAIADSRGLLLPIDARAHRARRAGSVARKLPPAVVVDDDDAAPPFTSAEMRFFADGEAQ